MPKPLDTKKIAAIANSIESLKAQIAKEEAELARLCGVAVPDGEAPKRGRPRKSKMTRAEGLHPGADPGIEEEIVRGPGAVPLTGENLMAARDEAFDNPRRGRDMPNHDPDRTPPADGLNDIPPFLKRGGSMTDAERVAAAERAMAEEAKP